MRSRKVTALPGIFAAIDCETADYGWDSVCALSIVHAAGQYVVAALHLLRMAKLLVTDPPTLVRA